MNLQISNLKSTCSNPSTSPNKKAAALEELRTLAATNPEARGVLDEIDPLKNISLLISVPSYDSRLAVGCALSIMRLRDRLKELGVSHELQFVLNRSLVTKARNEIANYFLFDTKHTHLFQIDNDLSFHENDFIRALASDADFVGLAYAFKTINWASVANAARAGVAPADLPKAATTPVTTLLASDTKLDTKLQEVKHVGSGLLSTKRMVFQKLAEAHPEWRYLLREAKDPIYSERKGQRDFAYAFFGEGFDADHHILSEDFKLCEDWRALGGKVYLAPWAKTTHHGLCDYRFERNVFTIPAVKG